MENKKKDIELVVIGGSAGSLTVIIEIIKNLDPTFNLPVVIVVHRPRNVLSQLTTILNTFSNNLFILEPDDKQVLQRSCIYIAPQNYHLLLEKDFTCSLDYSEPVHFSRPSIDVTFESAARMYKNKLVAILLSGANDDGTEGLMNVFENGGIAIAQEPSTAEYPVMPKSAINYIKEVLVMHPEKISAFLNGLISDGK